MFFFQSPNHLCSIISYFKDNGTIENRLLKHQVPVPVHQLGERASYESVSSCLGVALDLFSTLQSLGRASTSKHCGLDLVLVGVTVDCKNNVAGGFSACKK